MSAPVTDLQQLLKGMDARLAGERYVFASVSKAVAEGLNFAPVMQFVEDEGVTLILQKTDADAAGIEGEFECQKITLHIHSALEAVGFMAAISNKLKEVGVPCNVVAGYYHDHLFIPVEKVETAMEALKELSA